ncbi:MAG: rRNA maturation RNase YbeY [Mycoplasmataceae bacterium]|jgi:probable rRNA maturation factor|nr:rRNA maturation RNase YbeY [Mycoplasmataceae bacterium]
MLDFTLTKNNSLDSSFYNIFINICNIISEKFKIKEKNIFDVTFVSDEEIKKINKKYRHIDEATDVISFALNDGKVKTNLLGEIYISVDTAKKECKTKAEIYNSRNPEYKKIICLLFIHGILHLLGLDHDNKRNETKMFGIQEEILDEILHYDFK